MTTRREHSRVVRQRKTARVLILFRNAIPAGELDKEDWGSLKVAARLVYETEDLRVLLHSKRAIDRDLCISHWVESMESAIEFMSWVKALASIVKWQTYAKERLDLSIDELWQQHRLLALRLLGPTLAPERRLSLLVELGGLELSLLGQLWWLKPSSKKASPSAKSKNDAHGKLPQRRAMRRSGYKQ
jgi:hypothetical protein